MATAGKSKHSKQPEKKQAPQLMVFKKQNYILLAVSLAVIILGFTVMSAGDDKPFDDPMKITVAPLIVLAGFALGVFSILYSPKTEEQEESK